MSEQVTLYKFKKRINSNKLAHNGTTLNGNFRGPIDIMTPSIDIKMNSNSFDYNYLTWYDSTNDLLRYYWIRHKVYYPDNIVNLTLEEDVLPTFKAEIQASVFLIERSASLDNGMVSDTAPVSINGVHMEVTTANPFEHYKDGWYVVGIAGGDSDGALSPSFAEAGGVYYYFCNYLTVINLLTWLNGDGASGEWGDYNPLSRVISIRYFPIAPDSSFIVQNSARIFSHSYDDGKRTVNVHYDWNGYFVNTTLLPEVTRDVIYTKNFNMNFSNHYQYADGAYLNFPPYRELILFAGGFGKIEVPLNLLPQNDSDNALTVSVSFDLITGLSRLELYFDSNRTNLIYSTEDYSMTVDCAITSERYNKYSDILARDLRKTQYDTEFISKAGAGAAAMVAGAAMQNPMVFGSGVALLGSAASTQITGLKQYALDSYNLSVPDFHTKASNGSFSIIEKPWNLYTISHLISDFPYDLLGYACYMESELFYSLGYTKCIGASFESEKATLEEITEINDFLNSGFYNEFEG